MVTRVIPVEPFDLVVFGASGDLSRRKLLPALYHRDQDGQVPEQVRVIGVGNTPEICEPFGLTSIDLSAAELGRRAARMALRLIRKNEDVSIRSMTVSPTVVARNSTRGTS